MKLTKKEIASLQVRQDPTELRCFAIRFPYEYEPREFCWVWLARELNEEIANQIFAMFKKSIEPDNSRPADLDPPR